MLSPQGRCQVGDIRGVPCIPCHGQWLCARGPLLRANIMCVCHAATDNPCCQVLDANADGYVRGEAVVAMVLGARCSETSGRSGAAPPSHLGLLLLLGSAVNQDGRSSALTAPNGPAQQRVLSQAMQAAGVSASRIDVLSMHGTGECVTRRGGGGLDVR